MSSMLGDSIYAVYAKHPSFSYTIKGKCVAMCQTRSLHRLIMHQIIQRNQRLHLVFASS